MKKILLPTDFSDNSWNAIKYALQLYKNETCVFTLLNTYTPLIYQYQDINDSAFEMEMIEMTAKVSKEKLESLSKIIEQEFSNPNHTFSQISSFNTLTDEIKSLYKANVMDLIVMGTKGATGLQEVLFGSNTIHVLKHAKCPIIAVPSGFEFETPRELLFPSDYQIDFQDKQLQPIIDIATSYQSRINILNVRYQEELTEVQKKNRDTLEHLFTKTAHLFHDIHNQNVPEAITIFQLKTPINLLVMINNKHSFFENLFFKSNINQIGFHLTIPFLVIPSTFK
ncbi:universal stress protein [Psychroserpens sp. NJDZ02]|uniref:universal stress protein n=1 Tax=Psychroserpens sp. NJDZ02 TaxID=2570561 RepID=UPI0010A76D8F|nr:universal stress protein [Psychroserpens sp. NJDZ02]QCE43333.1 universal stress protein [Psychroserpens sp. NJDZ02]